MYMHAVQGHNSRTPYHLVTIGEINKVVYYEIKLS